MGEEEGGFTGLFPYSLKQSETLFLWLSIVFNSVVGCLHTSEAVVRFSSGYV